MTPSAADRGRGRQAEESRPGSERRAGKEIALRVVADAIAVADEFDMVLYRIAGGAVEVGEADGAYVERVYDKAEVEVVSVAGWGTPPLHTRAPYPGSLSESAIESGTIEHVPDLAKEERPIADVLRRTCGRCAALVAPLLAVDRALGALVLLRRPEHRDFTADDATRIRILANIAALTFRRAVLLEDERRARGEAERRAREEAALRRATEAVTATYTVSAVLEQIARSALDATDADTAVVSPIVAGGEEVEAVTVAGVRTPPLGVRVPYRGSLTERAIEAGQPVVADDIAEDPQSSEYLIRYFDHCSVVAVPLEGVGEAIGALFLLREPGSKPFHPDEVARAHTFGKLAALAFHKVQLLEESEKRREELERVSESRARLMRGFSHDVKNPLGAADGHLSLLEEGVFGEITETQREKLGRIRRSIGSALDLIGDLVELARAEAGQIDIEREPADVREIAREMVEEYRAAAEGAGLRIELEPPDKVPLIESDASRIRQILGNVLSNAVKYTPAGGRVTVRVSVRNGPPAPGPGEWIAIDVADTGPGIPEEERAVLFQEFARFERGGKPGAGLGLAISRRVARALGGEITIETEVGKGSTFTLWLPITPPADRADGVDDAARPT